MSENKIVIIGGVAGGASCAARCRRLDKSAKIIVIDRGPYVSFSNCGLPYYVANMKLTFLGTRGEIDIRTRRDRMPRSLLISYGGSDVMID